MSVRAGAVKRVGWTCPTCGKSMASEGGFKVHLSLNHPDAPVGVDEAAVSAPGLTDSPADALPVEPPSTADDAPIARNGPRVPRAPGGAWDVKIAAEGAGESMSPAASAAFLAALRDEGAQVSTTSHANRMCHYAVELTVHADGVLTAVLRGIAHFQAAAQASALPAVRVVGIDAQEAFGVSGDEAAGTR